MALQVWLPLNGNINNQGIGKASSDFIISGATFDSGKTGKNLIISNQKSNTITIEELKNKKNLTIAFWFKMTPDKTFTAWSDLINFSIQKETTTASFRLEVTNTSGSNVNWFGNGVLTNDGGLGGDNITKNIWYHMCIILNGTTIKKYINGILNKTHTIAEAYKDYIFTGNMSIGDGGMYTTLADIRVYDECLSEKQVKEISKGLVAHYKMGSQYETTLQNIYDETYSCGNTSQSSWTKTKLENERGYNYKMTYTGTGSNSWPNMHCPTFAFTIGKRYYYSVKVRCHKWTGGSLLLRAARCNNDWVASSVNVCSPSLADGKWHEYKVSTIIPESFDRSGTTVTSAPCFEFYTSSLATEGFVYDMDFDLKDIQVVESDEYVPFINNNYKTNYIADLSGNGYNGIKNGKLLCQNNSPRYNTNLKFDTGTDYIKTNINLTMSELSISFWIKPNASNGGYSIITSAYNNPGGALWLATNCESKKVWAYRGAYIDVAGSLTNDVWYHCVYTFNNGVSNWYINGEKQTLSRNTYTGTTMLIKDLCIGNSYTGTSWNTKRYGGISDFRLYSTELSANDILTLYKNSGIIDNKGNMYGYEFIEEDSNILNITPAVTNGTGSIITYPLNNDYRKVKIIDGTDGLFPGLKYNHADLPMNKTYKLSFNIKVTDGVVNTIGGHSAAFTLIDGVYIDGRKVSASFANPTIAEQKTLLNDRKVHYLEAILRKDITASDSNLYIQLNRNTAHVSGSGVELYNIKLEEYEEATANINKNGLIKGYFDEIDLGTKSCSLSNQKLWTSNEFIEL